MAHYQATFVIGGAHSRSRKPKKLKTGDYLTLRSAYGKKYQLQITQAFNYNNKRVYLTHQFGLIYADELLFNLPSGKTGVSQKARAV
ncbi:hypothetical protein GCM10011571_33030 [Marinithermofilum abyssi]|uniref:Uncharacterized protein n=1 Tax=Marinithermofilum abyssi TaxID=1571185 RepID=A0A8J2VE44_9BACL|nr:hypothetical protein [Marinithermofilum abyssi]GGE28324.1 hypothetical protein GCM10011571_33030 [Marinithermofilum abyssi]